MRTVACNALSWFILRVRRGLNHSIRPITLQSHSFNSSLGFCASSYNFPGFSFRKSSFSSFSKCLISTSSIIFCLLSSTLFFSNSWSCSFPCRMASQIPSYSSPVCMSPSAQTSHVILFFDITTSTTFCGGASETSVLVPSCSLDFAAMFLQSAGRAHLTRGMRRSLFYVVSANPYSWHHVPWQTLPSLHLVLRSAVTSC